MLTRILFVDDDEFLLAALHRLVWSYSDEWECEFADSGAAALESLAEEPFDIVVSDMRMPGMDGAALLTEVKAKHPKTIRIILSGQSDCETTFRAVGPAQLYLSKPCNGQELKKEVSRAFGLRSFLTDGLSDDLLAQHPQLHSLPSIATQVNDFLKAPKTTEGSLAAAANVSPLVAKTFVQLANCATGRSCDSESSVEQAISEVGLEAARPMIFSAAIYAAMMSSDNEDKVLELLQNTASAAMLARQIAISEAAGTEVADHAMLAGLLQKVGSLVSSDTAASKVDDAVFGAYLLQSWGLPNTVVEAVAFHRCPKASVGREFSPLVAVCAGNMIAEESDENELEAFLDSVGATERMSAWMNLGKRIATAH